VPKPETICPWLEEDAHTFGFAQFVLVFSNYHFAWSHSFKLSTSATTNTLVSLGKDCKRNCQQTSIVFHWCHPAFNSGSNAFEQLFIRLDRSWHSIGKQQQWPQRARPRNFNLFVRSIIWTIKFHTRRVSDPTSSSLATFLRDPIWNRLVDQPVEGNSPHQSRTTRIQNMLYIDIESILI
jgi:hypothetical protein